MARGRRLDCQPFQALVAVSLAYLYGVSPAYAHNQYYSADLSSSSKLSGSVDLVGNHTSHSTPPVTGFLYFTVKLPTGYKVTGGGIYAGVLPNRTSAAPVVSIPGALMTGNTGVVNMTGDVYSGISGLTGAYYLEILSTSPNDTLRGQLYKVLEPEGGSVFANLTGVNQTATGMALLYPEANEDKKTYNVTLDVVIRPVPALDGEVTGVFVEEKSGTVYLDLTKGVNLTTLNLYKQSQGMIVLPNEDAEHLKEEASIHKLSIKIKSGTKTGALESVLSYMNETDGGGHSDKVDKPNGAHARNSPVALLLATCSAAVIYMMFM